MIEKKLRNIVWNKPTKPSVWSAQTPLADPTFLLDKNNGCHVDHEGFDLNVIEQAYYKAQGIALSHDPTYYKDGDGVSGATAIIQPWCEQQLSAEMCDEALVIDHSHFVYRYPITGPAREQITQHTKQRPELTRMLSAEFKCGLDLCIDAFYIDRVEPIVHIEWDFLSYEQLAKTGVAIQATIDSIDWGYLVPTLLNYNEIARTNRVDAFTQANTRSQLLFGQNSYILIPTL